MLAAAASVASANATFIASGQQGGVTVDAEADFVFSNNLLTLTLTNLLANPTSVAQAITDFEFTIGTTTGTLSSQSAAQTVTVATDGSFVQDGPASPGWMATVSSGNYLLNAIGVPNALAILGPPGGSTYTNANGSIAGNGPHNPFVYTTATFVYNIAGVSSTTVPTNIVFSFNTTTGDDFVCNDRGGCPDTPEPGSVVLLGTGLAGLALLTLKSARKKTA